MTLDFETLFRRYSDDFGQRKAYREGRKEISKEDLHQILGAQLDMIKSEYGTLEAYCSKQDPNVIIELYSMDEAEYLLERLLD